MKNQEEDDTMQEFKDNQLQLLASTTVVEVGVDVPSATVMLIMDADRSGLAQLHQLWGRVGCGSSASYYILVVNPKNEMGVERMEIMTGTTNGPVLSERDLEPRGPGEVFGVRQSGMPQFVVGDIVTDFNILEVARQETSALRQVKEWWQYPAHQGLANRVKPQDEATQFFDQKG